MKQKYAIKGYKSSDLAIFFNFNCECPFCETLAEYCKATQIEEQLAKQKLAVALTIIELQNKKLKKKGLSGYVPNSPFFY